MGQRKRRGFLPITNKPDLRGGLLLLSWAFPSASSGKRVSSVKSGTFQDGANMRILIGGQPLTVPGGVLEEYVEGKA